MAILLNAEVSSLSAMHHDILGFEYARQLVLPLRLSFCVAGASNHDDSALMIHLQEGTGLYDCSSSSATNTRMSELPGETVSTALYCATNPLWHAGAMKVLAVILGLINP